MQLAALGATAFQLNAHWLLEQSRNVAQHSEDLADELTGFAYDLATIQNLPVHDVPPDPEPKDPILEIARQLTDTPEAQS